MLLIYFPQINYNKELTCVVKNSVSSQSKFYFKVIIQEIFVACSQYFRKIRHGNGACNLISESESKRCTLRSEENREKIFLIMKLLCFSIMKTNKEYFGNLNGKNVNDNKMFWKVVKPFIWDKIVSKEQSTYVENNEMISKDKDVAQTMNSFFSNIVTKLEIPEYIDNNSSFENIANPIIKLILKYRSHLDIRAVGEVCREGRGNPSPFSEVDIDLEISKEILNLDTLRQIKILMFPQKFSMKMRVYFTFKF